jgi:hypothetical protein
VPGRLVVRRIPDLNPRRHQGQDAPFDTWRFHAFFTTTDPAVLDTVPRTRPTAGTPSSNRSLIRTADLKSSALAHLPSGLFTANAAWLVLAVIAFNLTRAAATLTDTTTPQLAVATTPTIRRKLITIPARIATSARRITIHLPRSWPRQNAWTQLFDRVADPPGTTST